MDTWTLMDTRGHLDTHGHLDTQGVSMSVQVILFLGKETSRRYVEAPEEKH